MPQNNYIEIADELIFALQRGEQLALEQIYKKLSTLVYSLSFRLLNDEQLAAEVLQDTFLDVYQKAGSLKKTAAFVGWVKRIAVNHCFMHLRSPWHQRRVSLDSQSFEVEEPDKQTDADRADNLRDMERALRKLPDQARAVIWLHDVEGYTHSEIGSFFGKSVSFSKTQLARAYARIEKFGGQDGSRRISEILA